ncbi:HNH endonuclease [Sphingobium vermicomposti]|uniref:Uncharacterized protein (TIGR02646 family) n=1 Tax=Sphingobium vermicomposti TaxID=529005 RepID=A0A846M2G8_9SPHN|nr:HNH endonuclease [Sphingobium vermicomposti]NIJ16357.1 uncharacterized protein (TIGR02646 family) [Sphingobium vermicomposti]
MRRVDRTSIAAPQSLEPGGAGPDERKKAADHRTDPDPKKKAFKYKAYKGADVRLALETLFHGKCAYCEAPYAAMMPVDIEHYRPKGAVAEDDTHEGYWWLAMAWDNLLPSCIDCNRKREQRLFRVSANLADLAAATKPVRLQAGKKDSFPLAATGTRARDETGDVTAEHALLLDPCRDDPARFLCYSFDPAHPAGLIVPTGAPGDAERGAVSIQIFGLNRQRLVEDRTRLLRRLEFLGDMAIDLAASIARLEEPAAKDAIAGTPAEGVSTRLRLLRDRTLQELKAATDERSPYASMASAWLDAFKARLAPPPTAAP